MVRGHVLTLKSDEIYNAGMQAGMILKSDEIYNAGMTAGMKLQSGEVYNAGEKNGARKMIFDLIRDNLLSPAAGAAKLHISVADLEQAMAADSASTTH